mmetsp:Transcript_44465/g.58988  ORF Transcript_44465/g.58988 Transcript_44465/m.58988 type:complete len:184 (+) Transcript_44465:936-1487(+)
MPPGQQTSHCFPINLDMANPEIQGVPKIVSTYKASIQRVELSGPTYFAPLLAEFRRYTSSLVGRNSYPILLILTDGAIHDMYETIDEIYELAKLPCSIIIVGVGNADFDAMEELDGDGGRLKNGNGQPCERDIVQFVKFNQAVMRGDLAEQVLKEVPNQLVSYMQNRGIPAVPVAHLVDMPPQ